MRVAAIKIGTFSPLFSLILMFSLILAGCQLEPGGTIDNRKELAKLDAPKVGTVEAELYEQAQQAEKIRDFRRAAQTYRQLADKFPNKGYMLNLADSLRRAGDNQGAIMAADKALVKMPGNVDAMETKALVQLMNGEFSDAGKSLAHVLERDPVRWRSLNAAGILFAMRGRVEESMGFYEAALAQSPRNPRILNNLALTLAMDKQYDRAIDTFNEARTQVGDGAADPRSIDLNQALVYAIAGKLDDAERVATPHLSRAALYNNMGFYAYLAKNSKLAKNYLNMALTQNPTYYERAWNNLNNIATDGTVSASEEPSDPVKRATKQKVKDDIAKASSFAKQDDQSLQGLSALLRQGKIHAALSEVSPTAPVEATMVKAVDVPLPSDGMLLGASNALPAMIKQEPKLSVDIPSESLEEVSKKVLVEEPVGEVQSLNVENVSETDISSQAAETIKSAQESSLAAPPQNSSPNNQEVSGKSDTDTLHVSDPNTQTHQTEADATPVAEAQQSSETKQPEGAKQAASEKKEAAMQDAQKQEPAKSDKKEVKVTQKLTQKSADKPKVAAKIDKAKSKQTTDAKKSAKAKKEPAVEKDALQSLIGRESDKPKEIPLEAIPASPHKEIDLNEIPGF